MLTYRVTDPHLYKKRIRILHFLKKLDLDPDSLALNDEFMQKKYVNSSLIIALLSTVSNSNDELLIKPHLKFFKFKLAFFQNSV
jgi:hypothetical protein